MFLLIYLTQVNARAEDIIRLSEGTFRPQHELTYFADRNNSFHASEISLKLSEFEPVSTSVFTQPPGVPTYWFSFSVQNLTRESLWIEVATLFAWEIDLYLLTDTSAPVLIAQSGLRREERSQRFGHDFFELKLAEAEENEPRRYLMRVYEPSPFELPVTIGTRANLQDMRHGHDLILATFLGIVGVMLLYNLMLYLLLKERIYLAYLSYVLTASLVITYGNGYPLLDRLFPFLDWHRYIFVWFFPMYISISWFTISYLNVKERMPLAYFSILFALVLGFIQAILNLFYPSITLANLYLGSLSLLVVSCLVSGYWLWFKGFREARFYVIGWTILLISFFIYFATFYGLVPFNPFTRNITYISLALELGFFSIALADRLNFIRKQNKEAQDKLLQHTIEKELMQKELSEKLANEVDLKTKELQQTIFELNLSLSKVQDQSEVIRLQSDEIRKINEGLESLIEEKTLLIRKQNEQLKAYAYANSHKVRGPLARIMGLITLIQVEQEQSKGESYLRMLHHCAGELDEIIREMNGILVEARLYE